MRRRADVMIGIDPPWQVYRGWVELADGRRAGCAMHIPWPPAKVVPLADRHRLWRECVRHLRMMSRDAAQQK